MHLHFLFKLGFKRGAFTAANNTFLRQLLITLMLCVTATQVLAAQPYHVEVIVFERTATAYETSEFWRRDLALAYSPNYRLIQPSEATSDEEASTGRIFFERPNSTLLLKAEARALNQKNKMRVLFHKAWQQTLSPTKQAPSVIITGGQAYDGIYELSGNIRFSVNKFIHVDTNLWLTRFSPNYGQASEWPYPPLTPDQQHFNQFDAQSLTSNGIAGTRINTAPLTDSYSLTSDAPKKHEYTVDEIIVLEQSRRMRSSALHYIDHPRLGILIKIKPIAYSETETETR